MKRLSLRATLLLAFLATLLIGVLGCSPPVSYRWQDTRMPPRDDPGKDLSACRAYAAAQYQPGIPAGEPFLHETETGQSAADPPVSGTWRPDRSPWQTTNINALPVHDVPVAYTGYPGELDYSPGYLDAILEKCMKDRGWTYRSSAEDTDIQ